MTNKIKFRLNRLKTSLYKLHTLIVVSLGLLTAWTTYQLSYCLPSDSRLCAMLINVSGSTLVLAVTIVVVDQIRSLRRRHTFRAQAGFVVSDCQSRYSQVCIAVIQLLFPQVLVESVEALSKDPISKKAYFKVINDYVHKAAAIKKKRGQYSNKPSMADANSFYAAVDYLIDGIKQDLARYTYTLDDNVRYEIVCLLDYIESLKIQQQTVLSSADNQGKLSVHGIKVFNAQMSMALYFGSTLEILRKKFN